MIFPKPALNATASPQCDRLRRRRPARPVDQRRSTVARVRGPVQPLTRRIRNTLFTDPMPTSHARRHADRPGICTIGAWTSIPTGRVRRPGVTRCRSGGVRTVRSSCSGSGGMSAVTRRPAEVVGRRPTGAEGASRQLPAGNLFLEESRTPNVTKTTHPCLIRRVHPAERRIQPTLPGVAVRRPVLDYLRTVQ